MHRNIKLFSGADSTFLSIYNADLLLIIDVFIESKISLNITLRIYPLAYLYHFIILAI